MLVSTMQPDLFLMPEDIIAPLDIEPKAQVGDIYQLGRHRLMCGNSSNPEHVTALMAGNKPRLLVTDPPYGVNYIPGWRNKLEGYKRRDGVIVGDESADWSACLTAYNEADVAYIWTPSLKVVEFIQVLESGNYDLRSIIVWKKQHFAISQGHYHWQHELCCYAVKHGGKAGWIGDRKQSTVWDIRSLNGVLGEKDGINHPSIKPLECMERPIRNHEGDVYDPFVGTGTTLIASERQGRTCYAMEINPEYVDVAVNRWNVLYGRQ